MNIAIVVNTNKEPTHYLHGLHLGISRMLVFLNVAIPRNDPV